MEKLSHHDGGEKATSVGLVCETEFRGSVFPNRSSGTSKIELLDNPVRLSCRFTLCHPVSVDSSFLAFVHDLMVRFGMSGKICDNVRPEHDVYFSLDEFATFAALAAHYIAIRRAQWTTDFGTTPLAATTTEVYQQIILPRCQPGI